MARVLTAPQRALLRAPEVQMRMLFTLYLDSGTYRYCDDVMDVVDSVSAGGPYTYLGASALAEVSEITSGSNLAAEPITLTIDGNRLPTGGGTDPASVLRNIQAQIYPQRRTQLSIGLSYPGQSILLVIPAHAGRINHTRLIEPGHDLGAEARTQQAKLEIVIDSLALRYGRKTNRTRSHNDQLELDPTDDFYKFTMDAIMNERTLFWGKKDPNTGGTIFGSVPPSQIYDPYYPNQTTNNDGTIPF
jgi:hypothetical protein